MEAFLPALGVPSLLSIWQVSVFPLTITWYKSVTSKPSKPVKLVSLPLHSLLNQQILPFGKLFTYSLSGFIFHLLSDISVWDV